MSHDGAKEICDGSALIRNCDYIIGPSVFFDYEQVLSLLLSFMCTGLDLSIL